MKLKYDAFGRLVARIDRSDGTTVLSSYRYNGLGYRIIERSGTSGTPTRFIYDDRWRIVATYEGSATTPKKRLVHHCAGLAGFGGSAPLIRVRRARIGDRRPDRRTPAA